MHTYKQLLLGLVAFVISGPLMAAGLMTPKDSGLPPLEIKSHHVTVTIQDGYAITHIEQSFYNPHGSELDATYSFPVPDKAAVNEFTYWINGKPIQGEVVTKPKARKIYQEEKQAGRQVALTEQEAYKAFTIAVAAIQPQTEARVRLSYIQPATVDTGIGRYVYPLEEGGVDEEKLAFWTHNDQVKEAFSFKLKLRSSYPIDALRLPQHAGATITQTSSDEWQVELGETQAEGAEQGSPQPQRLDKDIVVYWRHTPGLPGRVELVTYKPDEKGRGTFMMTFTPGDDLQPLSQGRDWILVLDQSGSMSGKYQSLIEGVRRGLRQLNPNDRVRIFLFNNSARELTRDYVSATPENIEQLLRKLEQTTPNGGTNLYAGLLKAIRTMDADRATGVILLSDGVANVGTTEKKAFLRLLAQQDVRLFTFIMGNSANRPLLKAMAKESNGFAMNISNSDDISGKLMEATSKLTHAAFHDAELKISGVKVRDLTPKKIGSLYRGEQLIAMGHYWGDGKVDIKLKGKVSGQEIEYRTQIELPKADQRHPELERLWAFAAIENLQHKIDYLGQDADSQQAATDLALEYGLVTPYTSMIVVEEEQFARYGIERNNAKRLAKEKQAEQQRANQPVQNNRADHQRPMYNNASPSHSGGSGSMSYLILLLFPFAWWRQWHEKSSQANSLPL